VPEEGQEPPSFTPVELGDAQKLELLDDIVIIGFPEKGGTTVTVNTGVVEGKDALDEWVKTDARLIHGNSGGAAVNGEGKLIGIPTKVVVDSDGKHSYGAVGYLRPAHLVAAMVSRYQEAEQKTVAQVRPEVTTAAPAPSLSPNPGPAPKAGPLVTVRGVVKAADGTPVAGARVGLLRVGQEVSAQSLITWGGSNAEGRFELEKPVPPGRYTLRAKAIGYEAFSLDVEIGAGAEPVVIELRAPSND
jgi:S1-C subfamily serine protease